MPRLVPRFLVAIAFMLGFANLSASATAQPAPEGYGGTSQNFATTFDQGLRDLDGYWSLVFAEANLSYRSPSVYSYTSGGESQCGPYALQDGPFYCPADETIYLSFDSLALSGIEITDYGLIAVTAHEWGHHLQVLLNVPLEESNRRELQADCMGGVFTQHAETLGRLDPGDVTEGAELAIAVADHPLQSQNRVGAHGTNDERLTSFMNGYLNGLTACDLPLQVGTSAPGVPPRSEPASIPAAPALPVQPTAPLPLPTLIPMTLSLSQNQPFRVYEEGSTSLDQIAAGLPNPSLAATTLRDLGWQENAYRIFAADNPPTDAAGWVELSIHRVTTVDGAAALLPILAEGRMTTNGLEQIDLGLFSDQSIAMSGSAFNGEEITIFARRANLIVRATGISPRGDPTSDVIDAILIPLQPLADEPRLVPPEMWSLFPGPGQIPTGLTLTEEHARSAGTIATSFGDVADAERRFQEWGWRESAARVYTGATANADPNRVEISCFRFANDQAAAEALPYFLDARAAALNLAEIAAPSIGDESGAIAGPTEIGFETTAYIRFGPVLFRYTLLGSGDPTNDLQTFFR